MTLKVSFFLSSFKHKHDLKRHLLQPTNPLGKPKVFLKHT